MLKKSLFAIAVVALLASVASAGRIKVEGEWPNVCTYQEMCFPPLDIVMDIPYYCDLESQDPIKVTQQEDAIDHFAGCVTRVLRCNFALTLKASAALTSGIDGTATAKVNGADSVDLDPCSHDIEICVDITGLDIKDVSDVTGKNAGQADVKIGEVTLCVTPL